MCDVMACVGEALIGYAAINRAGYFLGQWRRLTEDYLGSVPFAQWRVFARIIEHLSNRIPLDAVSAAGWSTSTYPLRPCYLIAGQSRPADLEALG